MLGIPAHHRPQNLAQALGRTAYTDNCGIDDITVEITTKIRGAEHRPPNYKLVDLSDEIVFQTSQRPAYQHSQGACTAPVKPVRVEADRWHGVQVFEQQEKSPCSKSQHAECACYVLQSGWYEIHRIRKTLV